MFLQKTYDFCMGYSVVQVEGFFVERFVNLCSLRGIKVWDIDKKTEGIICLKINESDLRRLDDILKVTRSQMRIVKKIGVPNLAKLYKKRKVFAGVCFVSLVFVYVLSLFVWDIEIIGNETIATSEIEALLSEENFKVGIKKDKVDFDAIKNQVYLKRDDVLWMGISIKGVRATVEILERYDADDVDKDVPANIVADRDGVIQKISVRAGRKCVNVGDVVYKGDVLVSGVETSEHSDSILVRANADVKIKTWYTSKLAVPLQKSVLTKSGNVDESYKLRVGNYGINLVNSGTNFEKYDTMNSVKKLVLFGKFETPLCLDVTTFEELVTSDVNYTLEQAEKIAKKDVYDNVLSTIPNDAEVVDYEYNVYSDEDEIIVRITVECLESIGVEEKIAF